MRELCKSHNLALAPDGKCILCRRPALAVFAVRQETEDALSRIVTAVLGACLLAAFGALVYVWRLDPELVSGGVPAAGPQTYTVRAVEKIQPSAQEAARLTRVASSSRARHGERVARATHRGPLPPLLPDVPRTDSVRIVMYGAPWCYVCDRARDFLGHDVVELIELDIESDPAAARSLAQLNPMQTLPTFQIRGETIVGFSPYDLEQAVRKALAPPTSGAGMLAARPPDATGSTP